MLQFGQSEKNGEEISINGPRDATKYKIGMVHQHFKLVEVFSVIDNIILGAETTKFGFIQKRKLEKRLRSYLSNIN